MQNQVVSVSFNGFNVFFSNDAYINATQIAKQFGKRPVDFLKTDQTKEYISALECKIFGVNKITAKENQLVIVKNGGNNYGTWLHPKLAIFFARWLSAEFAVWCDEQIENMLHPALEQKTINTQQQHAIREAVNRNVGRTRRTFQAVYHDLYMRFQIPKYQDLLAKDFEAAIEFLSTRQTPPSLPHFAEDGRWLVIVRDSVVTDIKSLANYNCVNAEAFRKLMRQTKQQSEYLLELAKRMRIVHGDCDISRLDSPIEESCTRFII